MKRLVYGLFRSFGFDLSRINVSRNSSIQTNVILKYLNVNIVFDVGANVGQFAKQLRSFGYNDNIISFDPLSSAHLHLTNSAKHDSKWIVHPRVALGNKEGNISINVSENSVSSSILPMNVTHESAAPKSSYISSELCPITCLDSVSPQYLREDSSLFIKIDTQGYEWQVLEGATETLNRAQGILLELSLTTLYDGQILWREMIDRLERQGFILWGIQNGFTDPVSGRSLQVDAIFIRN